MLIATALIATTAAATPASAYVRHPYAEFVRLSTLGEQQVKAPAPAFLFECAIFVCRIFAHPRSGLILARRFVTGR
jgi:hypothetical protein